MRGRALALALGLLALLGVGGWFALRDRSAAPRPALTTDAAAPVTARARLATRRARPKAAIRGRVTAASGATLPAGVLACVRAKDAEAVCVDADASGAYGVTDLAEGEYEVWASAPGFAGPHWSGGGSDTLALGPGEQRSGIDLQLIGGALEIAGYVRDLRGTAIGGALVVVASGEDASFTARAGSDGAFTAWAQAGPIRCEATATGYTRNHVYTFAPVRDIVIELIPASTVEGIVVDAESKQPVAGATVEVDRQTSETDEEGRFRIEGLAAGRYHPTATAIGRYGEAKGSVLAPLGGTIAGVVIELHPAAVVAGRVLVDTPQRPPCPAGAGRVSLWQSHNSRGERARTDEDGFVLLERMLPGTYEVDVSCEGFLAARPYPDLVVESSDIDEVTWLVKPGARITGHVRSTDGTPIVDASVGIESAGGTSFESSQTDATGAFVIDGVPPGAFSVRASADGHENSLPRPGGIATLAAPANVDIVLERSSSLVVEVVDARGAPLDDVLVRLAGAKQYEGRSGEGEALFTGLEPGVYTASTESASVQVTIGTGDARTRLVAEPRRGTLRGKVVTAKGAPVTDAFVTITPNAGDGPDRTTLTRADGTFRFERVFETDHTIRAYREGSSEVTREDVPIDSNVTLTLPDTGEISGTVFSADGRPADDYTVELIGSSVFYIRAERVFHTNGAFTFRDLPPGSYRVSVQSAKLFAVFVDVTPGAHVRGVELTIQPGYAIRGRLVGPDGSARAFWKLELTYESRTVARDGDGRLVTVSEVIGAISDADGRFSFRGVPSGTATLAAADVSTNLEAEAVEVRSFEIAGAPVDLGIITK